MLCWLLLSRVPPEVADQPVTGAGLRRNRDRDGEQALAAGHEQRADPEHPGGEGSRDRRGAGGGGPGGGGRSRISGGGGEAGTGGPRDQPPGARPAVTSQPWTAISTAPVQATRPA